MIDLQTNYYVVTNLYFVGKQLNLKYGKKYSKNYKLTECLPVTYITD